MAKATLRSLETVILIGLVALSGWATYQRNSIWKDELSLWSDVINKSRDKYRGYNEIGMWYLKKNLIDDATPFFQKSIGLNFYYGTPHNNLGLCFLGKGLVDQSIEEFQLAITANPSDGMYHINLGIAYFQKGLSDLAYKEIQIGKDLRRMQKKHLPSPHPKIL